MRHRKDQPDDAPTPQQDAQPQDEAIQQQPEGEQDKSPHEEAKRWRKQLRATEQKLADTEQERDAHAQTIQALQRQAAEKEATRQGIRPTALWTTTELADLLNDDGTIDWQKLDRAITAAAKEFEIPTGLHVPGEGRTPQVPAGGQFSDAFRPAGR